MLHSIHSHPPFDADSTQAALMRCRGDLAKTSYSFKASLPPPRTKGLGMEVARYESSEDNVSLLVADVANGPVTSTPVAEWNLREERQAQRGEDETHASLAIRPGDKICAVNGLSDDDEAMADLIAAAADVDSPKAISLTLERARSDVLGPQTMTASLPPRPPRSIASRGRSNSHSDARRSSSRPTSGVNDAPTYGRLRRGSEPDVRGSYETAAPARARRNSESDTASQSSQEWKSLLSAKPLAMCHRHQKLEDDSSTRAPSVSSSGRSSSASAYERIPPVFIKSRRQTHTFARAGLATLGH